MSFLSFNKKDEEISLLIDIGSGTITTALVLFSKDKIPEFLYCEKDSFPILDKPESRKLISFMGTLLESMMNKVLKQGFSDKYWLNKSKKIEKVLISFSSPWYIFKSKHIHISKNKPFFITSSFLDSISTKEEKLFKKELLGDNPNDKEYAFSVIEKSIIHVKINGYVLNNSIGKKTKVFDIFVYMSAIAQNIEEKVTDIILKHTHLPKEKVLLHTFPLVSFSTVRDNFVNDSNFLLMDIAEEVTEISLIKDDVILQSSSFPLGRNSVIREITQAFKVSPEIAESTLHIYAPQKTDQSTSDLVQKVLMDIEKKWAVYFEDILHSISPEINLPDKIFILSDPDVAKIFIDFLKLSKTDSTSTFRKNMDITEINKEFLSSLYKSDPRIKLNEFIIILADFYNKMRKNQ